MRQPARVTLKSLAANNSKVDQRQVEEIQRLNEELDRIGVPYWDYSLVDPFAQLPLQRISRSKRKMRAKKTWGSLTARQ